MMRIPLEEMNLAELKQYLAVYSQVNLFTGKINNPELAAKAKKLIAQKKEENNAQNSLLH